MAAHSRWLVVRGKRQMAGQRRCSPNRARANFSSVTIKMVHAENDNEIEPVVSCAA
jgi:hypothetical protein